MTTRALHCIRTPEAHTTTSSTMSRAKRTTIGATVMAALLVAGAGAAFAYWTATGTGSGEVTTGTTVDFTITSTTDGVLLTPGGSASTITFVVTNPGAGIQRLSLITPTIANASAPITFTSGDCSAADYTLGTVVIAYGDIAANGTLQGTVTVSMINRATNQDDCKNVTVPVQFAAS